MLAGGVFNTTNVTSTKAAQDAFTAWECTTNFNSASEAISNGLSIGVPIYGVPVKLDDTYSDQQKTTWKSEHCSSTTDNSQSFSNLVVAMKIAAPTILQAWTECIETTCGGPKAALSCTVKSQAGGALFFANWLRTAGDDSPPKVEFFRAYDATCDPEILKTQTISEAGVALKCNIPVNHQGVFILQTSRGTCAPTAYGRTSLVNFSGKQLLAGPQNYKAEKIVFGPDAVLVTNGHRLTFEAGEVEVEGAPQIVSYEAGSATGRSAAPIQIKADRITGTSLQIINAGEDGAKGSNGIPGTPGAPGQQGYQRDWDITGCHGGSNGRTGGSGFNGTDGGPGQAGGDGGTVIYDIGLGIQSGAIQRLVIRTDGGKGGPGGAGGAGGPGGAGGQGAPGTSHCGGTDAGQPGPAGSPGRNGFDGPQGANGQIVNYLAGGTPPDSK